MVKVGFIFAPQNPQCVRTNWMCALDDSGSSHRQDAAIKC